MTESRDESGQARGISRRAWLGYAGAAVGGAAVGAGATAGAFAVADDGNGASQSSTRAAAQSPSASSSPSPTAGSSSGTTEELPEPRRYLSTQLVAPDVVVEAAGAGPSAGLLFTAGRMSTFQGAILDDEGEPVWLEPDGRGVADLRVQTYRGQPVLTYWAGTVFEGWGNGQGVILDQRYRPVATVRTGHGLIADLHEFELTERGTALVISYPTIPYDLTPVGGPADGWLLTNHVQEIDVASGEVLLDWAAHERLALTETHEEPGGSRPGDTAAGAFDPFHVNSVQARGDALLLSLRHTSSLVLIDRRTGEVRWRLGGSASDFEVPEEAGFGYQHDARFHGASDGGSDGSSDGSRLSLFDNNGNTSTEGSASSGLLLDVDERARTVRLVRRLTREDRFGGAMGNLQLLDGGRALVGWGTSPNATEFDADGEMVHEVSGLGAGSYRVYRFPWTGRPETLPDVAVIPAGPRLGVHVSWNGATEVARWRVLAGAEPAALRPVVTRRRTGFETTVEVAPAAYVAVAALDSQGRELARSRVVRGARGTR